MMIKKYLLITIIILVICSICFFVFFSKKSDEYYKKDKEKGIQISFSTDKSTYKKDEEFIVTYEIKNVSLFTRTISFGHDNNFLYSFLKTKPEDTRTHYDVKILEDYPNHTTIGRTGFTLKSGESLKTVYKYSPKENKDGETLDKITFSSSNFDSSNIRNINVSFPIYFEE